MAAVEGAALLVVDAYVVERVPRHEYDAVAAAADLEPVAVLHRYEAVVRYGQDLAEDVLPRLAEDVGGSGDEAGSVAHERRAARVEDGLGLRQLAHEPAAAARVVDMNVRGHDPLDVVRFVAARADSVEQFLGDRRRAGVEDGGVLARDEPRGVRHRAVGEEFGGVASVGGAELPHAGEYLLGLHAGPPDYVQGLR